MGLKGCKNINARHERKQRLVNMKLNEEIRMEYLNKQNYVNIRSNCSIVGKATGMVFTTKHYEGTEDVIIKRIW